MDPLRFSAIAHSTHRFLNPVGAATFADILAVMDLTRVDGVLDVGCGNGEMVMAVAEHFGCGAVGIDRSPYMIEEAERRRAMHRAGGNVRFVCGEGAGIDLDRPCRLVMAIGADGIEPQSRGPADTLRALADKAVPGGYVLWGEGYWRRKPPAAYLKALGAKESDLGTHAGNIAAGEGIGLVPLYARTASEAEWDEYEWRYSRAVEDFLAINPDDPDADAMRARIRDWRRGFLNWGRDTLGFGLYLFRT